MTPTAPLGVEDGILTGVVTAIAYQVGGSNLRFWTARAATFGGDPLPTPTIWCGRLFAPSQTYGPSSFRCPNTSRP